MSVHQRPLIDHDIGQRGVAQVQQVNQRQVLPLRGALNQHVHEGDHQKPRRQHKDGHQPVKVPDQKHQGLLLFNVPHGDGPVKRVGNSRPGSQLRQGEDVQDVHEQSVDSDIRLAQRMGKHNPGAKPRQDCRHLPQNRGGGVSGGVLRPAFNHAMRYPQFNAQRKTVPAEFAERPPGAPAGPAPHAGPTPCR